MKRIFQIILILNSCVTIEQTYIGTSVDANKSYNTSLKINKDSTINFFHTSNDNGIYAEYIGEIETITNSIFHIAAKMTIGQYYIKSFNSDTIYIQIDSLKLPS